MIFIYLVASEICKRQSLKYAEEIYKQMGYFTLGTLMTSLSLRPFIFYSLNFK